MRCAGARSSFSFLYPSLYLSIITSCNDLPLRKMCRNLLFPFHLFMPFSSSCSMCLFYPRSIFLPLSLNFPSSPYIMIFLHLKCVGARSTPLPFPFFNFLSRLHIMFSSPQSVLLSRSLTFHPRFSSWFSSTSNMWVLALLLCLFL